MSRALALSLLLALGVALAAPALAPAPASASTGTEVSGGLPTLPWQKIGQWILRNALTLFMIADEIWHSLQGGPGTPPEEPPPAPLVLEAG